MLPQSAAMPVLHALQLSDSSKNIFMYVTLQKFHVNILSVHKKVLLQICYLRRFFRLTYMNDLLDPEILDTNNLISDFLIKLYDMDTITICAHYGDCGLLLNFCP